VTATGATRGAHSEQFLLEHPSPKLTETTWRIIETQEKASITTLQSKWLITVEKGVITSVTINIDHGRITNISVARSTGNQKLDNAAIQWVKNNWVFSPNQTGSFQLPVIFRKGG
jgi:TonB family protein